MRSWIHSQRDQNYDRKEWPSKGQPRLPTVDSSLTFFSVSITREESILAKMFGLQYMLGASMPPSGVYITGTYVVGIYALLYCAVRTICEDENENKRARE